MTSRSQPPPGPVNENRFAFGENWTQFSELIDADRIREAETSLKAMLEADDLSGRAFLDIGSGSGLFSLVALRLGAARVHSFDFDEDSVRATTALRDAYYRDTERWTVEAGSVLDRAYIERLGRWDVVYSWGVLHHTGDLERAMENAAVPVAPDGALYIAIYNDQGRMSRVWRHIKRTYNMLPIRLRRPYAVLIMLPYELRAAAWSLVTLRPGRFLRRWTQYERHRGMSRWHDVIDWVGGYPFEVATPERVFEFYKRRGFALSKLVTAAGGMGCNEYVMIRRRAPTSPDGSGSPTVSAGHGNGCRSQGQGT